MKKKQVVDLIKYFSENNNAGFKSVAFDIAREFEMSGDNELARYIMSQLSDANTFIPQEQEFLFEYLEKIEIKTDNLWLPDTVMSEIMGIVNAVSNRIGINKFFFVGKPGSGKTEAAKLLAKILHRELYIVDFNKIIDSRLGQTQKNIALLFNEINGFASPDRVVVLFDEMDAIALDRNNANDLREMGRATTSILKGLDNLDPQVVVIATTNMYEHFDNAVTRRFDYVVNFNKYSEEDLAIVAENILDSYLKQYKLGNRDIRLFKKILDLKHPLPYPGELKNIIKTAVGFSDPSDGDDYFRRLYFFLTGNKPDNMSILGNQGFTVREIAVLTKKSKSSVSRSIKG